MRSGNSYPIGIDDRACAAVEAQFILMPGNGSIGCEIYRSGCHAGIVFHRVKTAVVCEIDHGHSGNIDAGTLCFRDESIAK